MNRFKSAGMQLLVLIVSVFLIPSEISGRNLPTSEHNVVKRSPQLSLTVLEDDPTTPRSHPPSIDDLEERRKALVAALIPGGDGRDAGGAIGGQIMSLTDLGLDLVGGAVMNAGEVFAPLRNATQRAREGFPRAGTVLNRVVDSAREYSQQVQGVLRTTASGAVNNLIRVFTTATSRGTEIAGGVFKLMRSLLDNLTFFIQNMVQAISRGLTTATTVGSQFLQSNFARARTALAGGWEGRLLKPFRDATDLGTGIVSGLASDLNMAQPWVADGVKSKLTVANALIPRVNIATILSPLADPETGSSTDDTVAEDTESSSSQKRESEKSSSSGESKSNKSEESSDSEVLELLAAANTESKSKTKPDPDFKAKTSTEKPKKVTPTASETKKDSSSKSKGSKSNEKVTTTTEDSTSTMGGSSGSIDDLFGITSNTTKST